MDEGPWSHHAPDMDESVGPRGRICGACGSGLIRWGSYRRQLRQGPERGLVRVRRLRCRRCGRICGALPDGVVYRRLDGIDTVGRIIAAGIRGTTVREIAVATGVPPRTVRDIAARYREQAPGLATGLLAMSVALGHHVPLAIDIPLEPRRRAAFGLGAAWLAARHRGAHGATPWRWLVAITGGMVLTTNTRSPGAGRRGLAVLGHGLPPGFDAGLHAVRAGHRRPSRRPPPWTFGRVLSSGATRHHQPPLTHPRPILPEHHQIARPPTAGPTG